MFNKNILLVGPLPISTDVVGGAKISFEKLVAHFVKRHPGNVKVINTSRALKGKNSILRKYSNIKAALKIGGLIISNANKCDVVVINLSSSGLITFSPLIWVLNKFRNTKIILRVFGGGLGEVNKHSNFLIRSLIKVAIKSPRLVLLQSKALVCEFSDLNNVKWFPTTRNLNAKKVRLKDDVRYEKLVFISQLRPEKGLNEILEASRQLKNGQTISIYGPSMPGFDIHKLHDYPNVLYKGILKNSEIEITMRKYDGLIFPTYYEGEGYPGIIIEAMQCGLPVIATRWKFIPEIIEDKVNGLLVEPKSTTDLISKIEAIRNDKILQKSLIENALKTGDKFRTPFYLGKLETWIKQVIEE